MDNPLGILTGEKELKLGIALDLETILILGLVILLCVAIGSTVGAIITQKLS